MITKLKIQVEEDKRIEEALKEWLEEKGRIIGGWRFGSKDCHIEKIPSKEKHAE
jgi:hypothetical protein